MPPVIWSIFMQTLLPSSEPDHGSDRHPFRPEDRPIRRGRLEHRNQRHDRLRLWRDVLHLSLLRKIRDSLTISLFLDSYIVLRPRWNLDLDERQTVMLVKSEARNPGEVFHTDQFEAKVKL